LKHLSQINFLGFNELLHAVLQVCVYVCETASNENQECIQGQINGCIDVPTYNHVAEVSVTEDWDSGMIMLLSHLLYYELDL